MTDNQIIKALEGCWLEGNCEHCPMKKDNKCKAILRQIVLDLINRQQAEIERLNKQNEALHKRYINKHTAYCELLDELEETKIESIKEFAERLKDKFSALKYTIATNRKTVTVDFLQEEVTEMLHGCTTVIDCVVEEFVGDKE